MHPGFRGGALWGGCCFDPKRNLLFLNSDPSTYEARGKAVHVKEASIECKECHGDVA